MRHPAIFLDRDGTIIRHIPYLADPARVELLPGTVPGLRALAQAGYRLVVISNQGGVALGYFDEFAVVATNQRMRDLLAEEHIELAGVYYCPHHPRGVLPAYPWPCQCRKPATGLIWRAAADLALDVSRSWILGDKQLDVETGHNAGCRSGLIVEPGHPMHSSYGASFVAYNLAQAAEQILGRKLE